MKHTSMLFCLLLLLILCTSCVEQSEYDNLQLKYNNLVKENEELRKQLDEIENGAERLYNQALELSKNNEFDIAEQQLKILFERHSETQFAKDGRKIEQNIKNQRYIIKENDTWDKAKSTNSIESFQHYLEEYPNGKYGATANKEIKKIKEEIEQEAYNNAYKSNSSSIINDFISKYPNHKGVSGLKKKLIQIEIDEIFGNSNTGALPSSTKTYTSNSTISSVKIQNNTGCNLVVRYSGVDVLKIDIPINQARTISLKSGSYKIAASACGANYAGTEYLQGDYSSNYYISHSYY